LSDDNNPTPSPDDVTPVTSETIDVPESKASAWEMPKPVFQRSSGYLPQGFEKRFGPAAVEADWEATPIGGDGTGAAVGTAPAAAPAAEKAEAAGETAAEIAPQPDIPDPVIVEPKAAPPEKKESPAARIAFIVLGLLLMAVFIAAFLAVIYYFFLLSPNESQGLN
jgi:hypothetical protein